MLAAQYTHGRRPITSRRCLARDDFSRIMSEPKPSAIIGKAMPNWMDNVIWGVEKKKDLTAIRKIMKASCSNAHNFPRSYRILMNLIPCKSAVHALSIGYIYIKTRQEREKLWVFEHGASKFFKMELGLFIFHSSYNTSLSDDMSRTRGGWVKWTIYLNRSCRDLFNGRKNTTQIPLLGVIMEWNQRYIWINHAENSLTMAICSLQLL